MYKKKILFYKIGYILMVIALAFTSIMPISATDSDTVRVGWYEDSYNITGRNGQRSGYGYEYEQTVASYTGWSYKYVNAGWSDLMKMIQKDQVDIMSGVSYTEDRAKNMLYSELPMGKEKYWLYADLKHTDISISDLNTLNGKRVGLLEGSIQATQFYEWEQAHNLHLEHVFVTSFEDAKKKVLNQELDCIVSTETPLWAEEGMTALSTTGGSDIYFVINKNRPDLKEKLDTAMRQIENDQPFYADELYQHYLQATSIPQLTNEEKEWLNQHGNIRIGVLCDDPGISSINTVTGEVTGIINDYVKLTIDDLGKDNIRFQLIEYPSQKAQMQALKNHKIDMIFHFSQNPYIAEKNGFILSNTVLSYSMTAISSKSYFNESKKNTVAVDQNDLLTK